MFDYPEVPLSFPQQLLRFFEYLRPGGVGSLFNLSTEVVLEGDLDIPALKWAVQRVSLRHDVLRTSIIAGEGVPFQRVATEKPADLDVVPLNSQEEEAAVHQFLSKTDTWEFDLEAPPFFRAFLGCLGGDRYILSLVVHHSVADGWSLPILVRDLAAFYAARVADAPEPLPLVWQYADYARHQHRTVTSETMVRSLQYWQECLTGVPILRLLVDFPAGSEITSRLRTLYFEFDEPLSSALQRLVKRERVTMFMALLSAYKILLHSMTRLEDIAVPTLAAGRIRRETENMVGFFLNPMLLRTRINATQSFREILSRVRKTCLGAYAHQEVPLLSVIEEIPDVASLLADEDFVIMPFQFLQFPQSTMQAEFGPRCSAVQLTRRLVQNSEMALPLDALVSTRLVNGRITGTINYRTDLFKEDTVGEMAESFECLTRCLVANPEASLATCLSELEAVR